MKSFKLNKLTQAMLACSIALGSGTAIAQESDEDVEVIQVTGIRSSLAKSQALKMDNDSIVEAISAEDIGKLPDTSIADSLSRLPGIATQRKNGRSQTISVRGLSPDFTVATLNGRQQVSSSDNRSVEFDMYPSELLSGVVVYKTPDATVMSQAIAGTIDMQTISPLQHGERTFYVSGQAIQNDEDAVNPETDDKGSRFTFSYIDQFADDTLGIAFGFSMIDSPTQNLRFENWGFTDAQYVDANGDIQSVVDPVTGENARAMGGAKSYIQSSTLERDTFIGVVEYLPSIETAIKLDIFYSDFTEENAIRGLEIPLEWGSHNPLEAGAYTVEDGLITAATYSGIRPIVRNDNETRESDTLAVGINIRHELTDYWTIVADVSYSDNERTDDIVETYAGIPDYDGNGLNSDTFSYQNSDEGYVFASAFQGLYDDPNYVMIYSPQGWGSDQVYGGQTGFYKRPYSTDELFSANFRALRDLDFENFTKLEFGVHYDSREKFKTTEPEDFLSVPSCVPDDPSIGLGDVSNFDCFAAFPSSLGTFSASLEHRNMAPFLGYNPFELFNSDAYLRTPDRSPGVAARQWLVEEDVITLFGKIDIDAEIGDIPVRGNFGVQFVYTDQSSDSRTVTGFGDTLQLTPITEGKDYWETLPSLNLNFTVSDQSYVRLGLARVMARARMDELRAGFTYSYDENEEKWTGGGGNPQLDPWIANQVDISYEYYFDGDVGYFALAYFYKDLDSYVNEEGQYFDYSPYLTDQELIDKPVTDEDEISVPKNLSGGSIDGFEVSLQVTGGIISDAIENFGLISSASFTDSSITPNQNNPSEPLPGLSEDVINATLYYENENFSARVSARYRSEFLGEVAGFDASRQQRFTDEETLIDAQLSYAWTEGQLEGLTILLQGSNLSDEEFSTYNVEDKREIIDYQTYGRTYSLGVSYKF